MILLTVRIVVIKRYRTLKGQYKYGQSRETGNIEYTIHRTKKNKKKKKQQQYNNIRKQTQIM